MEKSEAARQEEQQRKALEAKAAAVEKQVLQLQVRGGGPLVPCTPPARPLCLAHPATRGRLSSAVTVAAGDPGRAGTGTLSLGLVTGDAWSASSGCHLCAWHLF